MDDLIYGLLIIAWLAYGIYSASKKNQAKREAQNATQPTTSKPNDVVESILESLFQGNSSNPFATTQPYSNPNFAEETVDNETYLNEIDNYEENDYLDVVPDEILESKIDTYSGSDNVQQAINIEEDDEIQKSAIANIESTWEDADSYIFDLRRGIIAKAILDRPYK